MKYLLALFALLFAFNAYGYLDPGTGSLLIQGLIAALLGGGMAIKLFFHRIKQFFATVLRKCSGSNSRR